MNVELLLFLSTRFVGGSDKRCHGKEINPSINHYLHRLALPKLTLTLANLRFFKNTRIWR